MTTKLIIIRIGAENVSKIFTPLFPDVAIYIFRNQNNIKDIILAFLKENGVSVGVSSAIEFYGDTVKDMDMEERMTLCNMAIEGGAKVGMVAPDEKTFEYIKNTDNMGY